MAEIGSRKKIGNQGEAIAERYLSGLGYKILGRNVLLKSGEVDILAKDKNCLVIVEVKTTSGNKFGPAKGYVNYRKQHKLRQLAAFYLQKYPEQEIRIDVIGIELNNSLVSIEHLKNAVGENY